MRSIAHRCCPGQRHERLPVARPAIAIGYRVCRLNNSDAEKASGSLSERNSASFRITFFARSECVSKSPRDRRDVTEVTYFLPTTEAGRRAPAQGQAQGPLPGQRSSTRQSPRCGVDDQQDRNQEPEQPPEEGRHRASYAHGRQLPANSRSMPAILAILAVQGTFGGREDGQFRRVLPMRGELRMAIVLLALLIVLIFCGLGFALHVLWWIAIIALVVWLLGFVLRFGESAGRSRRRWFHW